MDYYSLRSVIGGQKSRYSPIVNSSSFYVAKERPTPYIEPTFEKDIFDQEKPTAILVSAVAGTGKSVLAKRLSHDTGLPLLDLGLHEPVAAHTLTGLLTKTFNYHDIGSIFKGLSNGSYGIIIDAIDEGRSKTTEKAFEAFLSDIVNLSQGNHNTTFLMLGRSQSLEDCWLYLTDKSLNVSLITIEHFSVENAKKYIDELTNGVSSSHATQYRKVRDFIIDQLEKAFTSESYESSDDFLKFIGYPPVLDSIATLLNAEKNYHKLLDQFSSDPGGEVEISLLHSIANYILRREREEKVLTNIVEPLMADAPEELRNSAISSAYCNEEQSERLISYCLNKQINLSIIPEPGLNEKYEESLENFLQDHPFISGSKFRNAVFEAFCLATLICSSDSHKNALIKEYVSKNKHSYHFAYMLDCISADQSIPEGHIHVLFSAAMEFNSLNTAVQIRVEGQDYEEESTSPGDTSDIEVEIEIFSGENEQPSKTLRFTTSVTDKTELFFGPKLGCAFVSVPCNVVFGGAHEIEMTVPIDIRAGKVIFDGNNLILKQRKQRGKRNTDEEAIFESYTLESSIQTITTNGNALSMLLHNTSGVAYPSVQYSDQLYRTAVDPLLQQKYLRLRRILLLFRSHSRGSLAKYKHKIEHERTLKNEMGRAILNRLLKDKVLLLQQNLYHLDQDALNRHLGVTWHDLRHGAISDSVIRYLSAIS